MAKTETEIKKLKKRLNRMTKNARSTNRLMGLTSIIMHKDILNHFKQEEGPDGKWKQLDPKTVKRRRVGKNKSRGHKILQDTGLLRASLILKHTKNTARVGSRLEYAGAHNNGTGNVPERKFLWISKKADNLIEKLVGKHYVGDL